MYEYIRWNIGVPKELYVDDEFFCLWKKNKPIKKWNGFVVDDSLHSTLLVASIGPIFFVLDFCVLSLWRWCMRRVLTTEWNGEKPILFPIHPFLELIMSVVSLKFWSFLNIFFSKSSEMHSDGNPQPWTFKIPTEKLGYKNRGK
jgi:hypothetical protein